METTLWNVAFGLMAGVVGWTVAEFFGQPFRRGVDLIARVRVEMIRYANLRLPLKENREDPSSPAVENNFMEEDKARLITAQDTFRGLGAELRALAETEPAATFVLKLFGRDLRAAATGLIGLSNSNEYGGRRHFQVRTIEKALCFKSA
jgi:hypothetical protein